MNKYLQSVLFAFFIIIMEAVPFLYNDTYTVQEMKWGWVIGMPIILLIANFYYEKNKK